MKLAQLSHRILKLSRLTLFIREDNVFYAPRHRNENEKRNLDGHTSSAIQWLSDA